MRAMLDTSVLVGRIPDVVVDGIEQYSASFLVRGELARGLGRFRSDPRATHLARMRAELLSALDALPAFWRPFDASASDAYGRLRAEPHAAARTKDALIAAHALAFGVPLLTADRGFTRFADLELEVIQA